MQLGMIGLGRMGANLTRRLLRHGHEVVAYDVNADVVAQLESEGAIGATTLEDFVNKLSAPRAAWIMVPAAYAQAMVDELAARFDPGDTIIDGGNSFWHDDVDRAETLATAGLHYIDVGTSGGVFGLERGFCLMIGGEEEPVDRLRPLFEALAPGVDAATRTKAGPMSSTAEAGYLHCGPAGAGHFVKMVHNGIEYGLMAAYAEGLNILAKANAGRADRPLDAENAPLRDEKYYRYELNVADIAELWRRGSVVSSWLLDLAAAALAEDPALTHFSGRVSDSGEGRWTIQAAVDEGVPAHVLSAAVYNRFASRGESGYGDKVLSAMRKQFGGHTEQDAPLQSGAAR